MKCDACGKFVAAADLETGAASHKMVTPDAEGCCEDWETLCKVCNDNQIQQSTTCPQCGEAVGIDGLCDQCELAAKDEHRREVEESKRSGLSHTHQ